MKNIPILVDGPNYINRLLELSITPFHVSKQLSMEALRDIVADKVAELPRVQGHCESVEFVCSKKRFGPGNAKFTEAQQTALLDRLRAEIGVYVDIVDIPGTSEKGVDMTISGKLEDYAGDVDAIVLITADRDFIPTLRKLRHKAKIILIALSEEFPVELSNEAYATISLHDEYRGLFKYEYPRFFIDDLTVEKCSELYSEADDRVHNQLRVTEDGYVYLSQAVGTRDLIGIRFRFETYCCFNGYVGPKAASKTEFIIEQQRQIRLAWKHGAKGYIDYPVESVCKEEDNGEP